MELGSYKIIIGYAVAKYISTNTLAVDVTGLPFTDNSYLTFLSLAHATYFPNSSLQLATGSKLTNAFTIMLYDSNNTFTSSSPTVGVHYIAVGI